MEQRNGINGPPALSNATPRQRGVCSHCGADRTGPTAEAHSENCPNAAAPPVAEGPAATPRSELGDYSCVCGFAMKEPCEHWKAFLANQAVAGAAPSGESREPQVAKDHCSLCGWLHIGLPCRKPAAAEPPEARAAAPCYHKRIAYENLGANLERHKWKCIDCGQMFVPERQLDEARRELQLVDDALARRPALDDVPTRYAKIEKAINTAKRAESAEAANQKLRTALQQIQTSHAIRGNEKLFGCEEFYRGYNSGLATAEKNASQIAATALLGPQHGQKESE